jgi:hypothetical protein
VKGGSLDVKSVRVRVLGSGMSMERRRESLQNERGSSPMGPDGRVLRLTSRSSVDAL